MKYKIKLFAKYKKYPESKLFDGCYTEKIFCNIYSLIEYMAKFIKNLDKMSCKTIQIKISNL